MIGLERNEVLIYLRVLVQLRFTARKQMRAGTDFLTWAVCGINATFLPFMIRLEQKMVAEARLPLSEMVAGIPTLLTDVTESCKADCNEERTRYYAGDDPFKIDRVGVCCAVVVITNCGGFATFDSGEIMHV